jgi:hypothetical protein
VLVANDVLPPRDDQLAAAERFLTRTLTGLTRDGDRRLVHAYATWQDLRRLRATAARSDRPRTHTNHARTNINAAVDLLTWLADHGTTLAEAGHADIDTYLAGQPPSRYRVRDFLQWAAAAGHTDPVSIATPGRNPGPATDHDQRWAQIARLLHDEAIELTDRVAGASTASTCSGSWRSPTTRSEPKAGKSFSASGPTSCTSPNRSPGSSKSWHATAAATPGSAPRPPPAGCFPGLQPGRPLTAARLGDRLRKLGIRAQPGHRAAMTHLAAQLPAAVIADLLGIHPVTAVHWVHDAGGDWNRYAAELSRDANHQP